MRMTTKFEIQFAAVDIALAGPLIFSGMSSTDHIQLMPCHPIEKPGRYRLANSSNNGLASDFSELTSEVDEKERRHGVEGPRLAFVADIVEHT